MNKVLVSSCFLGDKVRYDGGDNRLSHSLINEWKAEGRLVSFCPEISGGLSIPRPAAEILFNDVVFSKEGDNVSDAFLAGALKALEICKKYNIKYALMKESSPSCGSTTVYDGSFTNQKIFGEGVTVSLLRKHGIQVFSEFTIANLADVLND